MSRLQISIVTFNNERTIATCLQSVRDETAERAPESVFIDVLDNASTDGTGACIRADFPEVRLHVAERNQGFGAGHNRILSTTHAERTLLLNPDAWLTAGALGHLSKMLSAHSDLALVGPRLDSPEGSPEVSFGNFPGAIADVRQRRRVRSVSRGDHLALDRLEADLADPFRPDWISGACMLGRTGTLREVGLFDERFFLYLEDVDLCKRLRDAGHFVAVEPRARVTHEGGGSRQDASATTRAFRSSRLAYEEKHGTRLGAFLYRGFRN